MEPTPLDEAVRPSSSSTALPVLKYLSAQPNLRSRSSASSWRLPIQIILFPVADIIVGPELEQLLPDLFHGIGCGGLDRLRDHVPYHLPHEILGRSRLVLPGGPRVGVSVGEIVDRRFYVTTENGVLAGLLIIRYGVIDLVYLVPPLLDAVIVGFLLVLLLLDLVLDKHFCCSNSLFCWSISLEASLE